MSDSGATIEIAMERIVRLEAIVGAIRSRHEKLTSSKKTGGKDDWRTPAEIIESIKQAYGSIELDPCASPHAQDQFAENNYTGHEECLNGLLAGWHTSQQGVVFVNPPYSEMAAWSKACIFWASVGVKIVVLARNSRAKWFKAMRQKCSGMVEHPTRIKFVGEGNKDPATFDSVYILFNLDPQPLFDSLGCTDTHGVYRASESQAA